VAIHPTAVVHPRAELGADVEVGPYCVVGPGAQIGRGTRLLAHVVVEGPSVVGEGTVVHPFAVLGGAPQAKKLSGGAGRLVIGSGNVVREHVTIHRGTEGRATEVGHANMFMVGSHVAHDVRIGSHCTLANGVQLAGHAVVGDHATFGGLAGVAQFVRVGESAFVAAGAMCEKDVPPFVIVQGDRARVRALNVVGLRRRGVPEASIAELRRAFRAIFATKLARKEALAHVPRGDRFVELLLGELAQEDQEAKDEMSESTRQGTGPA
jgi:UDP-N-acetylglucosamine acyltransferase